MPIPLKLRQPFACAALCLLAFWASPLPAQIAGPGWLGFSAKPVAPEVADRYFEQKAQDLRSAHRRQGITRSALLPAQASSATAITPEIRELARGLKNDPKLMFDYVRNHIDWVATFGSAKGATLTYYDGSGNDFDQAALLIALLRAGGFNAKFQYGTMTFPMGSSSPLANLVGSENRYVAILANGGIPFDIAGSSITMTRVWVSATINGTNCLFDPGLKTYVKGRGLGLGNPLRFFLADGMKYSRTEFLAAAGGTITSEFVQNLNESAIAAKLVAYSSNLTHYLNNYPNPNQIIQNWSVMDVLVRRAIVPSELEQYPVTLPYSPLATATWDEIPAEFATKIRIRHAGIDHGIFTTDFAGKRLTLTYTPGAFEPELRLDGGLIVKGSPTTPGALYDLTLSVDHPFPANGGTYVDASETAQYKSGATYVILTDFGGTSESLIRHRERHLRQARSQGLSDTSEAVLGETLNIVGLNWARQCNLADALLTDLSDFHFTHFRRIGRVAQEESYYIDVGLQGVSLTSRYTNQSDTNKPPLRASVTFGSALEHSVWEQAMGSSLPAVSTVKLLQVANATGKKIYFANGSTFPAIRPQLVNYPADKLNEFGSVTSSGGYVILPEDGQLTLNQWKGSGYISTTVTSDSTSHAMVISGNLSGGYGTRPGPVAPKDVTGNLASNKNTEQNASLSRQTMSDPVSTATGAYLFDQTDLAMGVSAPLGLAFSRHYNSNQALNQTDLGHGWTHNYDIWLARISHADPMLADRHWTDAVGIIAALYVSLDLLNRPDNLQGWAVASLVAKWAADQLVNRAVNVSVGQQVLEFTQLPDGTYNSPPGITTKLVANGNGTFSLRERFGTRLDFNSSNRIASITDIDGNSMTFTYAGDHLTTVTDAFGRTLTFQHPEGRIAWVVDSAGRSVSYSYDTNGDLVTHTDPEGKVWRYGYDTQHQMTSLANPLGITTASNVYDAFGRVINQIVPSLGGVMATYQFYFSGYRNVEEDPNGGQTSYFFDRIGNTIVVADALGHTTHTAYDGHNHVIETTDPKGNKTIYGYDGHHNLVAITNALRQVTRFLYDSQFRMINVVDALGHKTRFDYDSKHHRVLTVDALSNQVGASYYPNGLTQSITNGRGIVTTLTYDSRGNPARSRVASHPPVTYAYDVIGRMTSLTDQVGATTSFDFDKRGLTTRRTDPLTNSTIYVYEDSGRLSSVTDRNGDTVTYLYTPSGKLATIRYGETNMISFSYDAHENRTRMADPLGATRYIYDAANRLISVTDPHGFAVGYGYDEAGNLTQLVYPGNKVVAYTYDVLNRLKTIVTIQVDCSQFMHEPG